MPLQKLGYSPKTAVQSLKSIQNIFKNVFGNDVNLDPASENGLFIQQLANLDITNEGMLSLIFGSLYNPSVSSGIWLDSLASLTGLTRNPALPTVVNCVCTGIDGTIIPKGSQVGDNNKGVYSLGSDITIGSSVSGEVSGLFSSIVTGSIPAPANSVTLILNRITGWVGVNNPIKGVLGQPIQSDNSLRAERVLLLGKQGSASSGSILGEVSDVKNVSDVIVLNNNTAVPATIQGVVLPKNSVYVSVIGGTDLDIGRAIYTKISPGIPMSGNTSGVYIDPVNPQQLFNYKFQRPVAIPLKVSISIEASTAYPPNLSSEIKKEIVNNFNGNSSIIGINRVKIGAVINVSRFYPTLLELSVINIISVTIKKVTDVSESYEVHTTASQIGTLIESNVVVTVV